MKTENFNDGSLFTRKQLFEMEFSPNGSSYGYASIPLKIRRKACNDNMHLMKGMKFTSSGIPQMAPYTGTTDFIPVAYTERKKHDGRGEALHFFIDDYKFRVALWEKLEYTSFMIRRFDTFFTPDYTLWENLPTEEYNRRNIFKTRFIGCFWQKIGFNVIPTASVGDLGSLSFCNEGLPNESVIAISGRGMTKTPERFKRFCYWLRRLEEDKHPLLILVYGEEFEIPGLHTKLKFIPDFIKTHLRDGKTK